MADRAARARRAAGRSMFCIRQPEAVADLGALRRRPHSTGPARRSAPLPLGCQCDTLERQAFGIGRLVAGGVIPRSAAYAALATATSASWKTSRCRWRRGACAHGRAGRGRGGDVRRPGAHARPPGRLVLPRRPGHSRGAGQGRAGAGLPAVLGRAVRGRRARSSTRAAVSGLLPAEVAGKRLGHGSLWSPSSASPSPLMCIPSGHCVGIIGFLFQFGLEVGHVRPNRRRPPGGPILPCRGGVARNVTSARLIAAGDEFFPQRGASWRHVAHSAHSPRHPTRPCSPR